MQVNRANEILHASETIGVQYNDTPVWIESVNVEEGTVNVYPQERPGDTQTVRAVELREVH